MANQIMNPDADFYFSKEKWQEETTALRKIALDCGLTETLKWGCPCYMFKNSNVVLIHVFKEYCAYLFFKGALMKDPENILVQQTENVQAARQVRFIDVKEIVMLKSALKKYIYEAVAIEEAGLKVELKKTKEFAMAEEFKIALDKSPTLKTAFEALTQGRQRAYLLHFSQPKQAKTRKSRIEKATPDILKGKGLND